jgi:type IV pilus assembly protein PilA
MAQPKLKFSVLTIIKTSLFLTLIAITGTMVTFVIYGLLNSSQKDGGPKGLDPVGTLARYQQAFFFEHERFAASITELNYPGEIDTKDYAYSLKTDRNKTFLYGKTKFPALKSYAGGVFSGKSADNELTTERIICIANEPGTQQIMPPIDAYTCGTGTTKWSP